MERRQVFRVLISVSNKDKLPIFAKELDSLGVEPEAIKFDDFGS